MLLELLQQEFPLLQLVNTSCHYFKNFYYKIWGFWMKSIISLKIHLSSWTRRSTSSNSLKSFGIPRFLVVLVSLEEIFVNFQHSNRRCWIISTVDAHWQQKGLMCLFYRSFSIQRIIALLLIFRNTKLSLCTLKLSFNGLQWDKL